MLPPKDVRVDQPVLGWRDFDWLEGAPVDEQV